MVRARKMKLHTQIISNLCAKCQLINYDRSRTRYKYDDSIFSCFLHFSSGSYKSLNTIYLETYRHKEADRKIMLDKEFSQHF